MQRSLLIYSPSDAFIRKCQEQVNFLGFFTLAAQSELPARKALHDIPVDMVLFDTAPDWDASLKLLQKLQGSHPKTPFILMFDSKSTPAKDLPALSSSVAGFYNKETPLNELLLEIARIFPLISKRSVPSAN